jgi:c-di-GMP-binding flagellar brake protein YcgR
MNICYHSDILDISAINKEEINKDQQIHNENYEIIASNNHEKLYSKVMNVNNNRINLHKSHGSTTRRRRITKYDIHR